MANLTVKTASVNYPLFNQAGEETTFVRLKSEVFAVEPNEQVMFDAVQTYLNNRRQATAKTKNRSEVRGGGRKPWRQKGTGRARAGSTRSPIWVGGGAVHTPDGTQNYKQKQNRKQHALALKSALSLHRENKSIIIVETLENIAKTKEALAFLQAIKAEGKVLIVKEVEDYNLHLAVRNLAHVKLVAPTNVSVYDLLHVDTVVFTKDAIKELEGGIK
ncbi:MAG: 50S ribosomal protein L4 [Erysipelotrichaceae bacterium]|nr:50S ribosomal protein L4 [Erysipelotrichaceae bacterium]